MLHFIRFVVLMLLVTSCQKSKFESVAEKIKIDGETRTYLLHVPNKLDPQCMLVIALHGGTGQGKNQEEMSGLSTLAEEQKFIVAYPDGLHRTWNAGECCGKASSKNVDDVAFINLLIDELVAEYDIDPNKVFITGMSNGGFMAYRLAAELSEKIAAIAPVAASSTAPTFNPSTSVSIIHFHSEKDENIPANGGVGDGLSSHYNPPVSEVLQQWATFNGCQDIDSTYFVDYTNYNYSNPKDSLITIEYYLTKDGGHSWPGGEQIRNNADAPSTAVYASKLMLDFFRKHGK